jgi:uncharacterized membrane protein YfcA
MGAMVGSLHVLPTLLILLIVFGSSILRGFGGFGFALMSVPLLATILAPKDAVVLAILLQLMVGLFGVRASIKAADWASLKWLLVGAVLVTPLGYLALLLLSPSATRVAIALIAISAVGLLTRTGGRHLEKLSPLVAGGISGFLNGLAAMPGPPILLYFLKSKLSPDQIRASMILYFLATSVFAALSVLAMGGFSVHILTLATISGPCLVGGNYMGQRLFRYAPPAVFRRVVSGILLLAAAAALGKALA